MDTDHVSFHVCNRNSECFKFFEPLIWKICVGYTDDDDDDDDVGHKCSISFLSCGEDGVFLKREV